MRLFKWTKANSVFLPEIDDEHRAIFGDTGELEQALLAGAPAFQVQEILHRLIADTEDHFAHEEKLMREARYPSFEWHKQQHDTVRKRMRLSAPLLEDGNAQAGREFVEFLRHWLHDHTAVPDRMLGAFLRNRQRSDAA